jgi:hypothetical protein
VEQPPEPPAHAGLVQPLVDREPVEALGAERRAIGHVGAADAREIRRDPRRDRRERLDHLALGVAAAPEEPHLAGERRILRLEIVERDLELLGEGSDVGMAAVDALAAQLRDLPVAEVAAQAETAPPDAILRLDHQGRHARLAKTPRRRQPGEAGADDEYLGVGTTADPRERGTAGERQGRRRGRCRQELAAAQRSRLGSVEDLVEGTPTRSGEPGEPKRASERAKEGCTGHGGPLRRSRPGYRRRARGTVRGMRV